MYTMVTVALPPTIMFWAMHKKDYSIQLTLKIDPVIDGISNSHSPLSTKLKVDGEYPIDNSGFTKA